MSKAGRKQFGFYKDEQAVIEVDIDKQEDQEKIDHPHRCGTCFFFGIDVCSGSYLYPDDNNPSWKYGSCRRYPPNPSTPTGDDKDLRCDWPITDSNEDWCGEWKSKEDKLTPLKTPYPSWGDMFWTPRTRNSLGRAGITSIEELIKKTPIDLLNIKNFGSVSLREVMRKLSDINLGLNMG